MDLKTTGSSIKFLLFSGNAPPVNKLCVFYSTDKLLINQADSMTFYRHIYQIHGCSLPFLTFHSCQNELLTFIV